MTTPASARNGGPNGAPVASSHGAKVDETPDKVAYRMESDSPDKLLEVPMFVEHFALRLGPGEFKVNLPWGPSVISSVTSVWVSVCELDAVTQKPISAIAKTEIYDVCPQDGGNVKVRGRMFGFDREIVVQFRALAI
ncbi:hypothetical protein ACH4XT_28775 [Streptomyces avidinii]|uniref:hypothetical protein n=1 Tax=Streptomyces avidinii TaxID=1895 RepID=UPI00378BABA5